MTINTNQALGKIQSQWTQWIKNEVEFKAIDNHDIQVLTTFTDYFGDGILFNIIENHFAVACGETVSTLLINNINSIVFCQVKTIIYWQKINIKVCPSFP